MQHSRSTGSIEHGATPAEERRPGDTHGIGRSLSGEEELMPRQSANASFIRQAAKGFVFSVDAAVCVLLVIAAIFLFVSAQRAEPISKAQSATVVEDALFALEGSGFIIQTIDTNSPTQAAGIIRQNVLGFLPGFDANVSVTSYTIDSAQCPALRTFTACFPDSNKVVGTSNGSGGADSSVSGKKYFLRKQPPGDCNVSYISLSGEEEAVPPFMYSAKKTSDGALFSEGFFAQGDLNVTFDVNVTPPDAVVCDQNVTITLSVSVPEDVRKPIDLMLVIDRSGSMSWGGVLSTSNSSAVFADGSVLFQADGSSGVRSINVASPLLPSRMDRYDPGTVVDVHGNYASPYVFVLDTSGQDQLFAVNRGNPSDLTNAGSIDLDTAVKLFVQGGYAYVAGEAFNRNDSGLVIINVSNPASMSLAGTSDTSDPREVFVDSNNYAYVADGSAGLRIINVANKVLGMPIIGTYNTNGTALDVVAVGNYAYVADGSNGLVIVNTASKSNPGLVGSYNTPGTAYAVKVSGNYAYVADNTSLHIINVSNPASPTLYRSYATPYQYRDVDIGGNYAYLAAASLGIVTMDWTLGPRINNAKDAANSFVDFNGWQLPPDQMGLSSFSGSATLDQTLTTNKVAVQTDINALVASGGTNIASGIDSATAELNSARHNPLALKFQVVLSDGQSGSGDSAAAAQTAKNSGIIIFTIGFGEDADGAELTTIANITGGEYHHASDANALQQVFNLIALKVAELANDANVLVPIATGATVVDDGNGVLQGGSLRFNAGDINKNSPFTATYALNFPCSSAPVCNASAFTFPGPGSVFSYVGSDGNTHTVDFNASKTLQFKSRDLKVDITGGKIIGKNNVSLDTRVNNIGQLDANQTTLKFRLNDTQGQLLGSIPVPALCSQSTPGCTLYSQDFPGVGLGREGVIYATINDDNALRECPLLNIDAVNCYGGPEMQVYVVDYRVWRS